MMYEQLCREIADAVRPEADRLAEQLRKWPWEREEPAVYSADTVRGVQQALDHLRAAVATLETVDRVLNDEATK